jgi:hypothetical protein
MLLRKNTTKSRNESINADEEFRTKSVQSLTAIIRRRSTLNSAKAASVEDESTPATNKLVAMLRVARINNTTELLVEEE